MCDDRFGLNILLHNPVTDEMLAVPSLPPTKDFFLDRISEISPETRILATLR
jgi:hypothetical protein